MDVTFARTGKRRYAVEVARTNAPDVVMHPAPGYDDHVPHDLVHFFVETHWGLRDGVYGMLAAGGDAHTFHDLTGDMRERRRMKVRNGHSGGDVERSEHLAGLVHHAWAPRHGGGPRPAAGQRLEEAGTDADELARAADELARLGRRWHALAVGGRLTLAWPWPERRGRRPAS
jgi:hypothetical protein